MNTNNKQLSKFLSYLLRHKPEAAGITLDANGWVAVPVLLEALKANGNSITFETLVHIVETNNKKRFAFNHDQTMIRASQGHSIQIDLGYTETIPPEVLYHGTATKNMELIKASGLQKMNRHHVHLSQDINTAQNVGQRHGKPVVFVIDTKRMLADGYSFYVSENNVWLTNEVPAKYLTLWQN